MRKKATIYGVLLAAGQGSRFGRPKQFMPIDGKPLLAYSLEVFRSAVDCLVIVVDKKHVADVEPYSGKNTFVVEGGDTRGKSLLNALEFIKDKGAESDDIVVTHDAARPFVTKELIDRSIVLAEEYGASSAGMKITDTVVKVDYAFDVIESVDRNSIMTVQTPQTVKFGIIDKYSEGIEQFTDLSTLLLSKGQTVKIFNGNSDNLKVTYPDDLKEVERILEKIGE